MTNEQQTPAPAGQPEQAPEPIFALDIGTRTVIGIVGEMQGSALQVLAWDMLPHPKRAMIDGQIEDIDQVARTALAVKENLESKLRCKLGRVHVAAAGRALKTQKASTGEELDPTQPITRQMVYNMELSAVHQAFDALSAQMAEEELNCVGYSVTRYLLDDYPISTLVDHKGKWAGCEIIATFLPSEVVESLYAAMNKCGLEVASLTLEPIAAMNAIIPPELRLLNLALVDIGAGTSDIAIADGGSITGYTMVTVAGDEITEAIIKALLVDFETAERLKRQLAQGSASMEYKNILGFTYSVAGKELGDIISVPQEKLCKTICERILEVNEKAPAALFLAGGGSLLPGLKESSAQALGIDESRVAIGGANYMKTTVNLPPELTGPEFATPIGIAVTAGQNMDRESVTVTVNGGQVRLYQNKNPKVMDILMAAGFQHGEILGRSGKSVTFELNREKKVVRGGFPRPAEITVNGQAASISTEVAAGDELVLKIAQPGDDAQPTLQDVVPAWKQFYISLNGGRVPAGTVALINGSPAGRSQRIYEMDAVRVYEVSTLAELCQEAGITLDAYRFFVNGTEQAGGYRLEPGDDVRYFPATDPPPQWADEQAATEARGTREPAPQPRRGDVHGFMDGGSRQEPAQGVGPVRAVPASAPGPDKRPEAPHPAPAREEPPWTPSPGPSPRPASYDVRPPAQPTPKEPATQSQPRQEPEGEGESEYHEPAPAGRRLMVSINGKNYVLPPKEDGTPYLFVDMLNFVDIDPTKPEGNIVLRRNHASASYVEAIGNGDQIEIRWDKTQ